MRSRTLLGFVVGGVAAFALTGCMPKMTIAEMKAKMPERPAAELDQLNDFAGTWEVTGTATMPMLDEPLACKGKEEFRWDGDNWYLVMTGAYTMGDLCEMKGHGTWTYDTKSRKYRSTWTDSMGGTGTGTATYDTKKNEWRMTGTNNGPFGKSCLKGRMKLVAPDTLEFDMSEYAGLTKTMEMKGTSKRVK